MSCPIGNAGTSDTCPLTPCAPVKDTIGASSPLVRFIVRTRAFFLCPSPELATVSVWVDGSSSSSSTRARFARARPGPAGGGDLRMDMMQRVRRVLVSGLLRLRPVFCR
jgi:hypothetical protein